MATTQGGRAASTVTWGDERGGRGREKAFVGRCMFGESFSNYFMSGFLLGSASMADSSKLSMPTKTYSALGAWIEAS